MKQLALALTLLSLFTCPITWARGGDHGNAGGSQGATYQPPTWEKHGMAMPSPSAQNAEQADSMQN